jgi:1,2-dihydroxy-3-keto-5-methylthiopentene dioxygenase
MKAYYYDNVEGDQRLPHFDKNLPSVAAETLEKTQVQHSFIQIDKDGNWEQVRESSSVGGRGAKSNYEKAIEQIAQERSYNYRDLINVSKASLGDEYESRIKMFFAE